MVMTDDQFAERMVATFEPIDLARMWMLATDRERTQQVTMNRLLKEINGLKINGSRTTKG